MRFIDTNLFLRYLIRDDLSKAERVAVLLHRLRSGEEEATTSEAIIAEIVFTLVSKKLYALNRRQVHDLLQPIIELKGLRLPDRGVFLRALSLFVAHRALSFPDALAAAHVETRGYDAVLSFDRGFDRIPGMRRDEP